MTEEERSDRRRRRTALLLLPLLLLGAALCFWTLFASVSLGEAQSFIPAPLGSDALANYGKDDIPGRLRSLSISIVEAVIRDRDPEEEDVGSRVEDVSDSLKSPVPTVTPKPGDPTGTSTSPPTRTPNPGVTGTATATGSPSPSPFPSLTATATQTDVPTVGPSSTSGPSPTPTETPCKVPPYIEIMAPLAAERFTLVQELPGQAFAYDPDNVNPSTCSVFPRTFPGDDGDGIPGAPEVHLKLDWYDGGSWIRVHEQFQNDEPYCLFIGSCNSYDLISGFWPDPDGGGPLLPEPINTGLHRMWAKVLQDDEGVASGWVSVDFYIDPAPTATPSITPTPSNTPTATPTPSVTPTPSNTPTPTETPVPPTNTPVGLPACANISFVTWNSNAGANEVSWDVENLGSSATMTNIEFTWPTANGQLNWIKLDGSNIWSGSQPPNSINTSVSGAVGSGSWELKMKFSDANLTTGYYIKGIFDGSCYAESSE